MLVKQPFTKSPIDTYSLSDCPNRQLIDDIFCQIVTYKKWRECSLYKSIDYTLYVLEGSITYQKLEGTEGYCRDKDKAIKINQGECVFLPAGRYYQWVDNDGVKFVTVKENTPPKLIKALKVMSSTIIKTLKLPIET